MKKIYFICAGLFLAFLPVYSQVGTVEPYRSDNDAKLLYYQDFEGDSQWETILLSADPECPTTLYTWQTDPVDYIDNVVYYKRQDRNDSNTDVIGSGSSIRDADIYNGSSDWEIAGVRDTFMFLYNGVIRTQSKWPEDSILSYDTHEIVTHTPASQHGVNGIDYGLDRYAQDGGNSFFRYTSANGKGVSSYSNGVVPEYDRALFVRLDPGIIEPFTSYRVTVYVKATQLAGTAPTLGLQLMRGYTNSEKDFPLDLTSGRSFNSTTSYKGFEENKWQKITLMSYYNNDSIADGYVYRNGYWWQDSWVWRTTANKDDYTVSGYGDTTMIFRFIKQPDKFFVRMSFRSDSTQFDVDNLSVTKSFIAGVEHYNDMLRVDFGYQTDLANLAEQARSKNKIAAVELPGEYFQVLARWGSEWEEVPILSAEYQIDGYMYMWAKPYEDGEPRYFEGADEVLVTFINPVDRPELALHYNGSLYPNGIDTAWLAAGKPVFNFSNEVSSYNPNITVSPVTGKIVKSVKDLAPVLLREPYEDGTFGLDPNLRSMTMKFSRTVAYDNAGESSLLTQVLLKQGGNVEYWDIESSDGNGYTTIVRPDKYTSPLSGDYVLEINHVTHSMNPDASNEDYGYDVTLNYHFGAFDANPVAQEVACSDWRNEKYTEELVSGSRYYPESVYFHSDRDTFTKGTGGQSSGKCGLYIFGDDDCQIYFSDRSGNNTGNLYVVETLAAGNYTISFKSILWGSAGQIGRTGKLFVYAKPDGELENGDENGFAKLNSVSKTLIGTFTPRAYSSSPGWPNGTETFEYSFSIPAQGEYMIEWLDDGPNSSTGYYGFAIGNYTIKTSGDLSFKPVLKLNEAIERAEKLLSGVAPEYRGHAYIALSQIKDEASSYIAKTIDEGAAYPSKFDSVVSIINVAITGLEYAIENGETVEPLVTTLYMDSVSCESGNRITIPVKMQNSYDITALSFDVILPDGVTFVEALLDGERSMESHQLYSQCNGQVVTLVCFSSMNEPFAGNDGNIIYITVDVDGSLEGDYQVMIENMELTSSATSYFRPDDTYGKLTVLKPVLPGDVNRDGVISISDAVGVVAFIINSDIDNLDAVAADADQNGIIDVADAVFIVNKVIHVSSKALSRRGQAASAEIRSVLSLDHADNVVSVNLSGDPSEITAMQFEMTLPAGVRLESLSTDDKHIIASGKQENGRYRIVCLSLDNSTFTAGGESAVTMQLAAADVDAEAVVVLNDARIVTPDGRSKNFESISSLLRLGNPDFKTVVIGAEADYSKMFDLKGRPANENSNGVLINQGRKELRVK